MTEQTPAEQLKEITDKLEAGISDLYESDRYAAYLRCLSKFHHYSYGNVLLILLQCPSASRVAGFNTWKKEFGRTVKRGETGIKILAPCTYRKLEETDKLDANTQRPVLDENGRPVKEMIWVQKQGFRIVNVFDVSQTEGRELPLPGVSELTGSVEGFETLTAALRKLSPVPVETAQISGSAKGYFSHTEHRIVLRPDMSETQTVKTLVHEIAHAKLHDLSPTGSPAPSEPAKDRRAREVEAESVAYVVCQHFGIETSDYSFVYIAGWSKGRELAELKSSLDCIRETAAELINGVEGLCRERGPEKIRVLSKQYKIPAGEKSTYVR
ncbi:MAG: ArdC-like ssDNA-binding domain-containing protein [Oscillospiraceae bacterium]|nr:ArdC-like ssDNA-binding domain-containing protein [Oscillospiraceae bacterium]